MFSFRPPLLVLLIWLLSAPISFAQTCSKRNECPNGLACIESTCLPCSQDSQCGIFEVCNLSVCEAKTLSSGISALDILGVVAAFVGAMLAAGGGLGGGGIFVPVFVLIIGMRTKQAVAISQAMIFGGSIINMLFNIPRQHPTLQSLPLIDYPAVALFTPTLLAGTTLGVFFNIMFPTWLIVLLLVLTLGFTARRTIQKTKLTWRAENEARAKARAAEKTSVELTECISAVKHDQHGGDNVAAPKFELKIVMENDRKIGPYVAMIAFIWVFVLVVSLIRGGKSSSDSLVGIEACSSAYWAVTGAFMASLLLFGQLIGAFVARKTERKRKLGWKPQPCEIFWSRKNAVVFPLLATAAGICGGLLGIGGGMIVGPLLLELGVQSQAVSATSAAAVFLSASSATIQYFFLDLLLLDYAIAFFIVGVVATLLGQTLINYLVKKYQRASLVIASIAAVIVIAGILMAVSGIVQIVDGSASLGFSSPC